MYSAVSVKAAGDMSIETLILSMPVWRVLFIGSAY